MSGFGSLLLQHKFRPTSTTFEHLEGSGGTGNFYGSLFVLFFFFFCCYVLTVCVFSTLRCLNGLIGRVFECFAFFGCSE